jgi:hypothetical protein
VGALHLYPFAFILSTLLLAERVGFEPTVPVKVQQFSRLPDSTTLAPLRELLIIKASLGKYQGGVGKKGRRENGEKGRTVRTDEGENGRTGERGEKRRLGAPQ